jgi:hypothetical protein
MQETTAGNTSSTGDVSQAAARIKSGLASADSNVTQGIQSLGRVHQARLSRASRTLAALTATLPATDPRVVAAQTLVAATKATIVRVSVAGLQTSVPVVQVSATGWGLQGRVLDAQLQPAARFTVFLVDGNKTFLRQYAFAYTDDTGYFVINYAGDSAKTETTSQLFIEIANRDANPVYLSNEPFQPVIGAASYQTIVLPAGDESIGDPPPDIRREALPVEERKTQ